MAKDIDAVLISHVHLDHLDVRSLRALGARRARDRARGAGQLLRRVGFAQIDEVVPATASTVGGATVTALPAVHDGRRRPSGARASTTLGYEIAGAQRVYFAGDTELFEGMRELAGRFDVALLPVWGWGPSLGPGHMDPLERGARGRASCARASPSPSTGARSSRWACEALRGRALVEPPRVFARHVAQLAPEVEVARARSRRRADARSGRDVSSARGARRGAAFATAASWRSRSAFAIFALVAPEGAGARTIELLAAGATLLVAVLTSRAPSATRRPRAGATVAVVGGRLRRERFGSPTRH